MNETTLAETPQNTSKSAVKAFFAGALAAIVCGLVWGAIGYFTDYQIGYVALLVGLAVGGAVRCFAPKRSVAMGALAAGLAVGGILLGKFCILELQFADDAPGGYALLHAETFQYGGTEDEHLMMYLLAQKIESGELTDAFAKLSDGEIDYHTAAKEIKANWKVAQAAFAALSDAEKADLRANLTENTLLTWYTQVAIAEGKLKQSVTLEELEEIAGRGNEAELAEAVQKYGEDMVKNSEAADKMLEKMSAEEKFALLQEMKSDCAEERAEFRHELRSAVFQELFSAQDVIFFLVALYAAYALAGREKVSKKAKTTEKQNI